MQPLPGVVQVSLPFPTKEDLFRGISEPERGRLEGHFVDKHYPRDAVIFIEGDAANALCLVRSGLVKLVSVSEEGRESILSILRPGEIFGELVISEERRPFSARAINDVLIGVLPRETLLRLLAIVPALSRNFMEMLAKRLLRVERDFAGLVNAWAHHRLARELLRLAEELGIESPSGTRIALRLTHEDLSNLIGTTRETVTLLLQKFAEKGILRREGRLIVVNKARLADYVHVASV